MPYDCQDCPFSTLFQAGAADHSKKTGHFVLETPRSPSEKRAALRQEEAPESDAE